jgi:hypothetical protein
MNKNHSENFYKLPLDVSSFHNNSWLSGFIDAEGFFYIRCSLKQSICKFSLEKQNLFHKTQESFYYILNQIAIFFNEKLSLKKRLKDKDSYNIIRIEKAISINLLIDYLISYPLASSKDLEFLE